ncbi:AhpC/TSA family protein [Gramella sp. GC03-9]|uniref:AhpC/TSA family protein n=1 Tax=Christiangramia oceanisediminis TaxID=2920386 RepID=A0A9X2KZW1_9FLAO|nr:TlpA disulfide reductase family protein [Gramella oceanisediminis]MCP9201284.1 AhpC/TSA family protein [Gramella oceanisediminis]
MAQFNFYSFIAKPTLIMFLKNLMLLSLISCNLVIAQKKDFSLSGKTSNINDGTYLFLRDLVNGGNIDSALVKNNSFKFETILTEPVVYTMLFSRDRKNFKEVWIEDSEMTFNSSNVDFKNAKITGSRNQYLFEELIEDTYSNSNNLSKKIIKEKEVSFIKNHPDAVISAYLLHGNKKLNKEEIKGLFKNLTDDVKQSSLGKKIARNIENNIASIGKEFPDFSIPNEKGEIKQISKLTGGLTLLQFWSSTCYGSRLMNPKLKEIYEKYHSEGFRIVGISRDRIKDNWTNAIKEDNLTWPQLSNLESWEGEVFQAYGISTTPSNILINEKGIIVERDIDIEDLDNTISRYLN